jgi:hypothetical protein
MRSLASVVLLSGALLWGSSVRADVTNPTPYDYDRLPVPGVEGGTYAFNGAGSVGPDCVAAVTGTAKVLPNPDGTGGTICAKGSLDVRGTGPLCPVLMTQTTTPTVLGGTYTYNGDGTICENLHIVGGPFDGQPVTFHTFLDPKGRWALPTATNIAYPCPGIVANGQLIGSTTAFKIGKHGDDPPGSGLLPCTNP